MKKVLCLFFVIQLIGCNLDSGKDYVKSKLTKNPFTICYTCNSFNETDSFEQKRGAELLDINKKENILFFYEFGFVDERLEDSFSNQEWRRDCMNSSPDFECDTTTREMFSNRYKIYYFKDTISGFQQMSIYYFNYDGRVPYYDDAISVQSIIYKYNKVFSLYTNEAYPKQIAKSYYADLNFFKEEIKNYFLSQSDLFDTTNLVIHVKDKSTSYYYEGYPKQILEEPFFGGATINIKNIYLEQNNEKQSTASIWIGTSKYASWIVQGDSIGSRDIARINKSIGQFDYQLFLMKGY